MNVPLHVPGPVSGTVLEELARRSRSRVEADEFFVIRSGIVGLEMPAHGAQPLVLETLGPGELLGVSWAFPPYRWNWRAVAQSDVEAVAFDASAVRDVAKEDQALRMALLEAVASESIDRLHATNKTHMAEVEASTIGTTPRRC